MNYPFIKLVVPTPLKQFKNGQLPANVLAPVATGGKMYSEAAKHFNALYAAAKTAGFKLRNVGDYRSFDSQVAMFNDRYVLTDQGAGVTRQYQGKTWYLKKGKAPSAAPDPTGLKGSNHGWGLAMDLGYENAGKLTSMGGKCLEWMCANAPTYGFYLQGSDPKSKEFEAWHWQYALGDATPSEAPAPPPPLKFDYPGTPVKQGSKGDVVKLVQAILGVATTGEFDAKTHELVRAWQKSKGLTYDGVVDQATWKTMFG